jgi:hypothetical protein
VLSSCMEKRIGRKIGGTNVITPEYWGLRIGRKMFIYIYIYTHPRFIHDIVHTSKICFCLP